MFRRLRIFGGDPQAYLSRNPAKERRFTAFLQKHAEDLQAYGLNEGTAREAIVTSIVFQALPEELQRALFYSHVVELTRVADQTQRAPLARASVLGDWTVRQLPDAVRAVNAGLSFDPEGEPPPALPEPTREAKPPQPGRLVTRTEKFATDLEQFAAQREKVDPTKLKGVQQRRVAAAVARARKRLEALAERLGV